MEEAVESASAPASAVEGEAAAPASTAAPESTGEPRSAPESNAPVEVQSTVGAEFVSGLLGAGIALACALIPIVHLVLLPLGPAIGGFVAGNRMKTGARGRAIIAVTIATAMMGLIALVSTILVNLLGRSQLPSWFPSSGTLAGICGGVWVYAFTLGFIGGTISGALGHKEAAASS